MAKKLLKNYFFSPGVGVDDNLYPNAYSLISQNKTFIQKEIIAYIQNLIDDGDSNFAGYTYDETKCLRDSGYVIDALLHDLRYGGNEQTRYVASRYWIGSVAQIDGNRIPEYESYGFARDLINDFILRNILDSTPEQEIENQVRDLTKTAETAAFGRVTILINSIIAVIQNGLDSLPVEDVKLGRIEVLGKVGLEDLLIITNVTDNTVVYSFTDPTKGGEVEFFEGNTTNYPNAITVNNGVTFIRFKYNTSSMSSTDSMQIFLENTEMKVRPYDFGTDAIERMRVAQPQAMIDADFEYGLQPTKWQAISMQRGYPGSYEVSASDINVVDVVTDASTGTSGVGASLITVTSISAHGLSVGDLITIRALSNSVTGFNRAEGTFVIYSVPSSTTFTYFAKSKVGTNDGDVLATANTQLRKAAFYTGASIGNPIFTVTSNGSSGSFVTALQTESGQNTVSFIGAAPPIGAPLSGTGIATGTQVSGVFGPSNSDGVVDYRYVKTTYLSGVSAIELTNVSGLSANMAVGNEASPNILREITSIVGNTLNLSGTVTVGHLGDDGSYTGSLVAVANDVASDLTLSISASGGNYTLVGIDNSGFDFEIGDTIIIEGGNLGGTSGVNDLYMNIDAIDTAGSVTSITLINPNNAGADGDFFGITANPTGSLGSGGGNFVISRSGGVYSITSFPTTGSSNYFVGNKFKLPGTSIQGATPANDVFFQVTEVTGSSLQNIEVTSGTAVRGDQIPIYATVTLSSNTTSAIAASETLSYSSIATIQVTFDSNHGFVPGNSINITIDSTGSNHELAAGPYSVESVPSLTTIQYTARAAGTIDTSILDLAGSVYIRPDNYFTHRPFDGGVMLGTGGPQHGAHSIRQSKKYIRYQSGKGAMYNTGCLFAPSFDVLSVTAADTTAGSLITIATDDMDHGLQAGSQIKISGVLTTGYDGIYTVSEIVDERTFKITAATALGSVNGEVGPTALISTLTWHGAVVRSGPFDDQNGIFFQYNGRELAVGRRSSTYQLSGTISINVDSNAITGTNTRFVDQLIEGDRIVIRGMTHVVAHIDSQTSMTVTPDFRGVSDVSGVKACKVEDLIIPQSEWNLDKCDGTGPSGYNVDVTKMQMIGIQFSWYGAGFIDWMFRGPEGNYIFCHRLKGNNLNPEAYMRTGNAPVRYEVLNESARGRLAGAIDDVQDVMTLDDVTQFPDSGVLYVDNELISYSGRNTSTNQLTGLTRSATLTNFAAGATRSYNAGSAASHNDNKGVVLVSCSTSPIISHWGSAYLIDGNFDEDRGYIFNYAATGLDISTTKVTAFLIRLAPSVSNAVTGDLGERELLNRAQLLLQSITVTSDAQAIADTGGLVIEGVLNPSNYPLNPIDISWVGLQSQAGGGQPSFAQIANGGSVTWEGGGTVLIVDATISGAITATFDLWYAGNRDGFNRFALEDGNNTWWIPDSVYDISGLEVGDVYTTDNDSGGSFTANSTIIGISRANQSYGGTSFTRLRMSSNWSGLDRSGTAGTQSPYTITIRKAETNSSYSGINKLPFTEASWDASGVTVGSLIADTQTEFPANTKVFGVTAKSFGGTNYYAVTFTQSYTTFNAAATVDFDLSQPPYAQPGEQVFSFISNPGETSTLELSALKELTTTAIGGRGTFPNGPDVLAINIYKVKGADVSANVILRWGEAQA